MKVYAYIYKGYQKIYSTLYVMIQFHAATATNDDMMSQFAGACQLHF